MPTSLVTFTFLDHSGEKSSVAINVPALTAGNIAATSDGMQFATAGELAALIASLSLCTPVQSQGQAWVTKSAQTLPGSHYAQREIGLMVSYTDNVNGKVYRFTIPGPAWDTIGAENSDEVNSAAAQWTAFKAKAETVMVSPDGNPITIIGGRLVGRNR